MEFDNDDNDDDDDDNDDNDDDVDICGILLFKMICLEIHCSK